MAAPGGERDPSGPRPLALGAWTSEALAELFASGRPCAALVPVGSVEPHGPHLPLATDALIGEAAAERAARELARDGVVALVAPLVPYGVTRFAAAFAGAVSVAEEALAAYLRAVADGLLAAGFSHVCLVNNHLEPEHDAAVRRAIDGLPEGSASVASPLSKRWARTLSDEFKSGACHAGRYETSLVLAIAPDRVDAELARSLPDLDISLSQGIRAGARTFDALGMTRAYTGSPREATAAEGEDLLGRLATMVATEVREGLARRAAATTP